MPANSLIRGMLERLRERTEAAAKASPGLRHMLVLPPRRRISIPYVSAFDPPLCEDKPTTWRFGETTLVGPLPPQSSWPAGFLPFRAIVAEQSFSPFRANAQEPYRIHLFFGGDDRAFGELQRLADDVALIRRDFPGGLARSVLFESGECLHGDAETRLDSWLCTVHWWSWAWADCPFRTKPNVLFADSVITSERQDPGVGTHLAFNYFDADILAASAATLALLIQMLSAPPTELYADYPPRDKSPSEPQQVLAVTNPSSEDRVEQSTAAGATGVERMTWQRAKQLGESHCIRNLFPGVKALAKIVQCSPSTMHKAINNSDKLRSLQVDYEEKRGRKQGVQMNGKVADLARSTEPDPSESADESTDTIFRRLVEQAEPGERARLNQMTPAQQRELVALHRDDPDDREQAARRAARRKPRTA